MPRWDSSEVRSVLATLERRGLSCSHPGWLVARGRCRSRHGQLTYTGSRLQVLRFEESSPVQNF